MFIYHRLIYDLYPVALKQSGATNNYIDWSTDIEADYGDIRPLNEAQMRKLTINGAQLLDCIDTNDAFVTELAAVGCITWPQREHIINIAQPRDRNDKLLEFLTRRSVADLQKFINILAQEESQFLITDGGETQSVSPCEHEVLRDTKHA